MMIRFMILALILHCSLSIDDENKPLKPVIGCLLNQQGFMRRAFSTAVRKMNECVYNRTVCDLIKHCEDTADLNCVEFNGIEFAGMILELPDNDLFQAYKTVRRLAGYDIQHRAEAANNEYGLALMVGPHDDIGAKYVQGLCEAHDLPHMIVRKQLFHDRLRSINLYPDVETLSSIYVEMVKKLNWTSFTVLYEKTENLMALDKVLKMYGPLEHEVYAFKLGSGPNYSEPLLRAKNKGHKSLIIDCAYDHLADILKRTQEVGMMTESYRYIVTSLDLQAIDLSPFQYSGVNISGLRMIDPNDPVVREFVERDLEDFGITAVEKLRIDEALMFDSIALFTQAYRDMAYRLGNVRGLFLGEDFEKSESYWDMGLTLRNYIMHNEINGLTGPVMLDTDGRRRRFKLDIMNLHEKGLAKVGMWSPDDGFDDLRLMNELKKTHLNILITMNPPYASRVNFSKSLEGNDRYEGFVIDIIKELSDKLSFNYTFHVQEDSQNGNCFKDRVDNCSCNGMLAKILSGEMHMAITDLTITEERELCVDFSTPFLNLGMSILYKKPVKAPATWYSFLSPFNYKVWCYLVGTMIGVSFLFTALGRLSPAEWANPYPCIEEPDRLINQFSLNNSFWFCGGAIMQQGSEIAPISKSTRILAGFWWFFCLIICSTYTANLAAFLTVESPTIVVRGIDDLYNQTKIKFGAKENGSTHMYFKSSKNKKHQKIAEQMESAEWSRYMVKSNEEGIKLAKEEDYAFLMESSSIEYIQYRECDLEQAGNFIDQKSYAIAYAETFEFGQKISRTISILQEKLIIKDLYDKWWKQKGAICNSKNSASNSAEAMTYPQLSGPFWVLYIGGGVAVLMTVFEITQKARRTARKEMQKFWPTLWEELSNTPKTKSVKPVLRRNKSTDSTISETFTYDLTVTTQG